MCPGLGVSILVILQPDFDILQVSVLATYHKLLFFRRIFFSGFLVPHVLSSSLQQAARRERLSWQNSRLLLFYLVRGNDDVDTGSVHEFVLSRFVANVHDGLFVGQKKSIQQDEFSRVIPFHSTISALGSSIVFGSFGKQRNRGHFRNIRRASVLLLGRCLSSNDQ